MCLSQMYPIYNPGQHIQTFFKESLHPIKIFKVDAVDQCAKLSLLQLIIIPLVSSKKMVSQLPNLQLGGKFFKSSLIN